MRPQRPADSSAWLHPILEALDAFLVCAVHAAEDRAAGFDAVADDAAAAVLTHRRERVDRALEAVERVRLVSGGDLKGLVVLVAADGAGGHDTLQTAVVCNTGARHGAPGVIQIG